AAKETPGRGGVDRAVRLDGGDDQPVRRVVGRGKGARPGRGGEVDWGWGRGGWGGAAAVGREGRRPRGRRGPARGAGTEHGTAAEHELNRSQLDRGIDVADAHTR